MPEQQVEKQPFIPYVEEREYPEMLKPVLHPYVRRMGFLPNALKLYMHRPEIAKMYNTIDDALRAPIEAHLAGEAAYVARPEV